MRWAQRQGSSSSSAYKLVKESSKQPTKKLLLDGLRTHMIKMSRHQRHLPHHGSVTKAKEGQRRQIQGALVRSSTSSSSSPPSLSSLVELQEASMHLLSPLQHQGRPSSRPLACPSPSSSVSSSRVSSTCSLGGSHLHAVTNL